MSQEIRTKISDWWQLISAQETIDTYTKFLVLTWKIIKDTAILLGFLILFVFVYTGLAWTQAGQLKQNFKSWREQVNTDADSQWFAEAGKAFWQSTKTLTGDALNSARTQLGMEPVAQESVPSTPVAPESQTAAQPQTAARPQTAAQPHADHQASSSTTTAPAQEDSET